MFCRRCGSLLPEGSDSCPDCDSQRHIAPTVEPYKDSFPLVPEKYLQEDDPLTTPKTAEPETAPVITGPSTNPTTETFPKANADKPTRFSTFFSSPAFKNFSKVSLSILFGILLLTFILVSTALIAVHPESASRVIENADVTWILEETDLGNIIVNELNASEFINIHFEVDSLNSLLKRENVSAEVGKVARKYARAISEGDYDYYLRSEEIIGFIEAVTPDIFEEFGTRLTDADYRIIADSLNNHVDLSEFSVGKIFDDADMDATVPYMLLSMYPLIIIGLLAVLTVFNTCLLHRKKIRTAFLCAGIPFALSGFICFLTGLLLGPYSVLFDGSGFYGITKLIIGVVELLFLPAYVYLAVGLISIIIFVVINRMRTQYMLIDYNKVSVNIWRIAGLITNVSVLLICTVFSLLFYLNIPK